MLLSLPRCLLGLSVLLAMPPAAWAGPEIEVRTLAAGDAEPATAAIVSGALDARFVPSGPGEARRRGGAVWLRLQPAAGADAEGARALLVRLGWHSRVEVFMAGTSRAQPVAADLPGFSGLHEEVYALPVGAASSAPLYLRVETGGAGGGRPRFAMTTLAEAVARSVESTRMIALCFGALTAMALAALLMWCVLRDRLLLLYAALFFLQAAYIVFVSGQGFAWPLLEYAVPLGAHAWNVPAALSGAIACLFVREIAGLRHYSPRVHAAFGWLAGAFVVLAFANIGDLVGVGAQVAAVGNVLFLGTAVFTLVVAFLAWRRGSRAAGWFLLAWTLLEVMTISTALSFLFGDAAPALLYYGLPLSMVTAAIVVALGVADRLLAQRAALDDARRRAEIDPLTGVLNRLSLMDRLESACRRAQARAMPLALLFIDLDHFKEINDSHGHLAGDACLKAVVGPIQAELRHSDVIGRYGGEEFVVILSSADGRAAQAIAERIRHGVTELRVEGFGSPLQLTCSIGVAASDVLGVWGDHLVALADAAVYAAKHGGRNRVSLAPPVAAPA